MGFMDKLKNIFFEEEEDEEIIEEKPKKEKEVIVKKVEVPKAKKEVEKHEEIAPPPRNETNNINSEEYTHIEPKKEPPKINNDLIFDDDDFFDTKKEVKVEKQQPPKRTENSLYKSRENRELYKKEELPPKKEVKKLEKENEDNKAFTPSPIISPIYGILDKNYKKDEVKEKKEIRLTSRPTKMDLDSVRNKAFGDLEYDLFSNSTEVEEKPKEKIKSENSKSETRKIYDMSKNDKPVIEKVTLGEADEYFNDLGLAYNTDYKDISKELNDGKIDEDDIVNGDKLEDNLFDLIESMYDKED